MVQELHSEVEATGLSRDNLASQTLVGLKRDIPQFRVREGALPYIYVNINVLRGTTVGGRVIGYVANVILELRRPVAILPDQGYGPHVGSTLATVWERAMLLCGPRQGFARQVREALDHMLTEFAADYYRQHS